MQYNLKQEDQFRRAEGYLPPAPDGKCHDLSHDSEYQQLQC